MLLILAVVLILVFAGAGFALKILWWGVLLGIVLLVAGAISRR